MGMVYAEILLINATDIEMAKHYMVGEEEIRNLRVVMMVDSGAYMMCINESIQAQLQLPFIEKKKHVLANGQITEHDVVGPLRVRFENRTATCSALVLEGDNEPLLGAIPMEEMDVLIHPQRHELIINPAHPDGAQHRL
ncbi:MAG: retroviral-like aspartic protease [Chitinophagaceae bacterium]|nr:MAG: retroviral-like aspartic protease [Chitinophagaceae bacterium]